MSKPSLSPHNTHTRETMSSPTIRLLGGGAGAGESRDGGNSTQRTANAAAAAATGTGHHNMNMNTTPTHPPAFREAEDELTVGGNGSRRGWGGLRSFWMDGAILVTLLASHHRTSSTHPPTCISRKPSSMALTTTRTPY